MIISELSWKAIRCDDILCPDAVAFASMFDDTRVLQYEANGGMDRSPLDDWTSSSQMFQRPALTFETAPHPFLIRST